MNFEIIKSFLTKNKRYTNQTKTTKKGYMQHSTGTPGAKAAAFIKAWNSTSAQAETEFIIDDTGIYQLFPLNIKTWHCGGSGNNTHVGCEICEPEAARFLDANWLSLKLNGKNNTAYAVKMLQKELAAWGYDPNGVDGIFGSGTKNAVVNFQKARGLAADGIVGKSTLHELQKRNGSYLLYDATENQSYFEDVYRKAVFTCYHVLTELGVKTVDKNSILSHAEGYKSGIASNHADVAHWWSEHGKTMDDFRNDVKLYTVTWVLPYEKDKKEEIVEVENAKDWKVEFEEAWKKATDAGVFDGTNPDGNITRNQLAVILNRLGLIK